MIYGRQIHQKHPIKTFQHGGVFKTSHFRQKYSWYMMTAIAGGALLFLLPAFYFTRQNYEFFKTIAYDTHPYLVQNLEIETTWLAIFLLVSLVVVIAATFFLSMRVTKNLLTPLEKIEVKMHHLTVGNWSSPAFQTPEDDDFRDLCLTFESLNRTLIQEAEADLKLLEKLNVSTENREAFAAWKFLIAGKRAKLGITAAKESNTDTVLTYEPEKAPSELNKTNVVTLKDFSRKKRVS